MSKLQNFFPLEEPREGRWLRVLCIYIYCRESGLKTFEAAQANTSVWLCEVRTKPIFLIHGLYAQGNCTRRTVPFFLPAHVNGTEWKICTREKKVALKLHESF